MILSHTSIRLKRLKNSTIIDLLRQIPFFSLLLLFSREGYLKWWKYSFWGPEVSFFRLFVSSYFFLGGLKRTVTSFRGFITLSGCIDLSLLFFFLLPAGYKNQMAQLEVLPCRFSVLLNFFQERSGCWWLKQTDCKVSQKTWTFRHFNDYIIVLLTTKRTKKILYFIPLQ